MFSSGFRALFADRPAAPSPLLWRRVLSVLLLCVIASCASPGSGKDGGESQGAGGKDKDESVPVKIARPQPGDISLTFNATTSIQARDRADVYARTVGFCQKIMVEEGDAVRQGDLLAKLDDREIRLSLDQSAARLEKMEMDFERSKSLFDEGLISEQKHQDLALQLKLARADHELARKRLDDTSIVAPIAGVITERSVKVGDLVVTTQPIFRIENLDRLEAVISVPERDFMKVGKGQEATLTVDAFPGRDFRGVVARVNPVIDSRSGTADAAIEVENQGGLLKPGMFVRVRIVTDVHQGTLVIPKQAILMDGDRNVAYVVRDGKAREVFVKTGFQDAERVEILEGLTPQDDVVVLGHLGLKGDTKVRIVE